MLSGNGMQEMREAFNLVGNIRYFEALRPFFAYSHQILKTRLLLKDR